MIDPHFLDEATKSLSHASDHYYELLNDIIDTLLSQHQPPPEALQAVIYKHERAHHGTKRRLFALEAAA